MIRSSAAPASPGALLRILAFTLVLVLSPLSGTPNAFAQDDGQAESDDTPPLTVADTVDVEDEAPEAPPLVGVGARLGLDPLETPASYTEVAHPLLADQNALTVSDALSNVAGVNVQTGSGTFDSFFLRGFDGLSSALLLTDGSIEPESSTLHLYNIDRVEVLRGSAGFLYGGRALAGTVNLVRERPTGHDFTQVGLQGGSFGTVQATIDLDRALSSRSGLRINGLWRESDGFRDLNESESWAINPSFLWRGERTTVGVVLEHVSNEQQPDGGVPIVGGRIADVEPERSFDVAGDFSEQDVDRFQLNLEHRISDRLSYRQKLYWSSLDWQSQGTLLTGAFELFPGVSVVSRTRTTLDDTQRFYGTQAELRYTADTGSIRHEILTGVEVTRLEDDVDFNVFLLSPAVVEAAFPVPPIDLPPFPIPGQARFGDVSTTVLAPFVIDQISFSERLKVLVGARYDDIDIDGDGTIASRTDSQLSPLAGVTFAATDTLSLYASWAESFEPQSTLVQGELDPEEGEQLEVGVKKTFLDGALQASLAVFELTKTNLAIPDQFGFTAQTGEQESRGVELEIAGRLPGELELRVAYAYTDAELVAFRELVVFGAGPTDFFIADRAGNAPPFAPEQLGRVWLSKRFENGFGLGGGVRYTGDQFIAADNAFELDGYVLLDASLFYTLGDLQLHLDARNLADEEYFTRALGVGSVVPAPGVEILGGFRYTL
ncbi:MAG: TonB-dependent siderophore receptor [Acidobacteriota bacterium]